MTVREFRSFHEKPRPAIAPFYLDALRILRKAWDGRDEAAYAALTTLFSTGNDVPAGEVLKSIRASLQHLSDAWEA